MNLLLVNYNSVLGTIMTFLNRLVLYVYLLNLEK